MLRIPLSGTYSSKCGKNILKLKKKINLAQKKNSSQILAQKTFELGYVTNEHLTELKKHCHVSA